jgi:hypothetical protein
MINQLVQRMATINNVLAQKSLAPNSRRQTRTTMTMECHFLIFCKVRRRHRPPLQSEDRLGQVQFQWLRDLKKVSPLSKGKEM